MSHQLNALRLICFALLLVAAAITAAAQDPPRYSQPDLFAYDELAVLGRDAPLEPAMQAKLDQLLTTPFLSNEAYYRGARPHRPEPPGLGPSLRVVSWNIERGFNLDKIIMAFTDPEAFVGAAAAENPDLDVADLREELAVLDGADVIVLNEADWGLKRSGYRSVARALAEALNMNWTYGVEFVEVDPIPLGTEQFADIEDEVARKQLLEATAVDPNRVQALHGTALLSRYPILDAKLTPFELQPYDWFDSEKSKSHRSRPANARPPSWCWPRRSRARFVAAGACISRSIWPFPMSRKAASPSWRRTSRFAPSPSSAASSSSRSSPRPRRTATR